MNTDFVQPPSLKNVGRRRYPTYWISGTKVLVRTPRGKVEEETVDQAEMAAEEGRAPWLRNVSEEDIVEFNPQNTDSPANGQGSGNGLSNGGHPTTAPTQAR